MCRRTVAPWGPGPSVRSRGRSSEPAPETEQQDICIPVVVRDHAVPSEPQVQLLTHGSGAQRRNEIQKARAEGG